MREISPAENWLLIILGLALSGIVYNYLFYINGKPMIGAVYGVAIGLPIIAFERRAIFAKLRRRIDQLTSITYILAALLAYEILMSLGYAAAGIVLLTLGFTTDNPLTAIMMPFDVFLYGIAVCAVIVFILRVRDLLGRDVFTSMLVSRYRQPVAEERVFLFIDLAGSTSYAEKHGDLRAQQFLKAIFATFAEPVRRHKGAIDDYIGDAAIVTWPLDRGVKGARCIRCVFDILADIEEHAASWQKRFGEVPRLRAALHGGPIITAEVGVDHHKIAFFGDTVNTTARLESLCKSLGHNVLISSELAAKIDFPHEIEAEDLGLHAVKGRGQMLGVTALAAKAAGPVHLPFELRIPAE